VTNSNLFSPKICFPDCYSQCFLLAFVIVVYPVVLRSDLSQEANAATADGRGLTASYSFDIKVREIKKILYKHQEKHWLWFWPCFDPQLPFSSSQLTQKTRGVLGYPETKRRATVSVGSVLK
jgi:hypothetical protein